MPASEQRPLRILFFLLHGGYLRHYREPLRILAERGHHVTLALTRLEKAAGDRALVEQIVADNPTIEWRIAPERPRRDPWRGVSWIVRGFADLARYAHPRYADAPALRERMARKVRNHLRTSHGVDAVSAWVGDRIVAWILSRPGAERSDRLVALFTRLDEAVPSSRAIEKFVAAERPDFVLVSPLVDMGSQQGDFLKSAQALGIRTGVCVASWDNLTCKGLMRFVPDRVIVWNDVQRREAAELHGIPPGRVVLTGAQRFDEWFERRPSTSPEEFRARVGLDPDRPYLLYLCSSSFIAPDEVGFVQRWIEAVRGAEDPALREIGVLVRPHPQNARQWVGIDLRDAGTAVWPREGSQPDAGDARDGFFDSIAHSAAVVGVNTSALIEAGIVGKTVFSVRAEGLNQEGTLHFHYLLHENGGFVHMAEALPGHVAQLSASLASGIAAEEQTRRFVESFVRPNGLENPAAPLVADAIEEIAALPVPSAAPERAPWRYRAPLVVAAAATWFGASARAAAWKARRRRPAAPAGDAA